MTMAVLASGGEGMFLVFALFIVIVIVIGVVQSGARRGNLEIVAKKFQGRVTSAWLSDTDLEMTVDGIPAHLSYHPGSKNRSAYTRLRFHHTPPGRLRVVPEGFWESLKRAFGSEDLALGDPAFDPLFIVQGTPVDWVRRTLDPDTRSRLTRLSGLGTSFFGSSGVSLESGPAGVIVAVHRNLVGNVADLEAFITESIELLRRIREPGETGIRFLSTAEYVREGRCPVCEHAFEGRVRTCESCATPHHADCWDYFGGCSTYACARRGGR